MTRPAVDRTWPLVTVEYAQHNPGRLHVIVTTHGEFDVYRGSKHLRRFPTHAEAIRWAQVHAARRPRRNRCLTF